MYVLSLVMSGKAGIAWLSVAWALSLGIGPCSANTDGGWSVWAPWSKCTASCDGGLQMRERECNTPPPDSDGKACVGDRQEVRVCNTGQCPQGMDTDGAWSPWTPWTPCTATCDVGWQLRQRKCDAPVPGPNGRFCGVGQGVETRSCTAKPCTAPVDSQPANDFVTCETNNPTFKVFERGSDRNCTGVGDDMHCRVDGSRAYSCDSCSDMTVRRKRCPFMCAYCKPPTQYNDETCDKEKTCHKSDKGCYFVGVQGSDKVCQGLGDLSHCRPDGSSKFDCLSCNIDIIKTTHCPFMCGYCKARPVQTIQTCAKNDACHKSASGCFYLGTQGTDEECRVIGQYKDGRDHIECQSDGSGSLDCGSCNKMYDNTRVATHWCPTMCGYCTPPPAFTGETCAEEPTCCMTDQMCFAVRNEDWLSKSTCRRRLGDFSYCRSDGSRTYDCTSCVKDAVRTQYCPYMCGYCWRSQDETTSESCAKNDTCYESEAGCFHHTGEAGGFAHGTEEECKTIGVNGDGTDDPACQSDGSGLYDCFTCPNYNGNKSVRAHYCPRMCGFCKTPPLSCGADWTRLTPNKCVKVSTCTNNKCNASNTGVVCDSGTDVARVDSAEDNEKIRKLTDHVTGIQYLLIDGSDREEEGTWVDSGWVRLSYENWGLGKPDDFGTPKKDCLGLKTDTGKWDDIQCGIVDKSAVVCQKTVGGWSRWSRWNACTATTCGVGRMVRHRKCDSPVPGRNGDKCQGDSSETCDDQSCLGRVCGRGWKAISPNKCIKVFGCKTPRQDMCTPYNAFAVCEHADVARIDSDKDNAAILEIFGANRDPVLRHVQYLVIDGNDREKEGVWRDMNRVVLPYVNWADGQPSDSGKMKNCVVLNTATERWEDIDCGSGVKSAVVCQRTV